ncbi:MAG: TIGR02391 family protein, partial [Chloroflexota bacterium]
GQALGGESPRLRVNRLQTETERNVQKGLEQILRGMYLAIRNPRSHEQIEDTKDTADAIIHFLSYLLSILDESQEPFTLSKFLARVFDPDFVRSDRYAELLVAEIPLNKRLDTLVEIYRKRVEGDGEKLKYTVRAVISKLPDDQTARFLAVVSDDLKVAQEEAAIRLTLWVLPPHLWPQVSEVARLRIENKLIQSIREGKAYPSNKQVKGTLGTWARDFLQHFTYRQEAGRVLLEKLESADWDDHRYVATYFMSVLHHAIKPAYAVKRCIRRSHNM